MPWPVKGSKKSAASPTSSAPSPAGCRDQPANGAVLVDELFDLHSFAHLRSRGFRGISQDRIERRPGKRKAERLEPANDARAARGDHFHSGQVRRRRGDHGLEDAVAEALEHAGRFGAEIFGAGLVAGKAGAVEEQDTRSRARK